MDPTSAQPAAPSVDPAKMSAPGAGGAAATDVDPLVSTWINRIKAGEKHWDKLHKRMRYNRKLVRGIDDSAEPASPKYNQHRANLIQSTISVVLSKVYAKNPEMSAEPVNKALDLRLFADTVSTVTQTMLEDAKLKKKAKASVRAAMTCSFGIVKLQYQRDMRTDPIVRERIEDTQDNIARLESLLKDVEDPQARGDAEAKKRELEETLAGLQSHPEVVAAEGLVIDRVRSDRLIVDPAVEDIWEYEQAGWMVEKIPMRKSVAQGLFGDYDLSSATTYKPADASKDAEKRQIYSPATQDAGDDPIIMVHEAWSKQDNRIYTLVEGCSKQFARAPYTPKYTSERWWPYFILPFQSVDGEFAAQSLVDLTERLQEEHNETRDKFAEVRRNIRPHFIASGDVKDKDIQRRVHPELGEIVVVNTNGAPLKDYVQQANQLQIDPSVFDTSPIRNDWEQVSGLQDAARSVVVAPKTATEASISDQSLAARVSEFRDQIEDWLTEIAQSASELCLLAMTPAQVETIMGKPQDAEDQQPAPAAAMPGAQLPVSMGVTPVSPVLGTAPSQDEPDRTYEWPGAGLPPASPETVFNLVQIRIRAGSTAAPNRLQQQENWTKVLPLLQQFIMQIRQIEAAGGDATPEREMVKETASRFDETLDVERFLPAKPAPKPAIPPALMAGGMGGGLPPGDPAAGMPHMAGGAPGAGAPGGASPMQ